MKDLFHNLLAAKLLTPQVLTASANSVGVDLKGFESVNIDVAVGVSGDTLSGSVYAELKLEESDTLGSGYTAVTDDNHVLLPDGESMAALGPFLTINDPAEDDIIKTIGYRGNKRFARIAVTLTGTHTNGIPVSIVAQKGNAHNKPVQ